MEYSIHKKEATVDDKLPEPSSYAEGRTGFLSPFSERRLLLLGIDILVTFLMVRVAFMIWHRLDPVLAQAHTLIFWLWFPILLAIWMSLAWLNDLYDIPSSTNRLQSITRVVVVATMVFLIYLLVFFVAPRETLPRVFFVGFLLLNTTGMVVWRSIYVGWFRSLPMQYRVLIVGDGAMARTIAEVLQQSPQVNYNVLGYVRANAAPDLVELSLGGETQYAPRGNSYAAQDGLPILGNEDDLGYLVHQLHVQELVVAVEGSLDQEIFQALIECQAWGVKLSYMADLYEKLNRSIPVEYIDPDWALHAIQDRPVFDRVQLALKRLLDLAMAWIGLLVLLAVFPFVALAIKLSSPGPIFYRQKRCGQAGKPFTILKFRTMGIDAEGDGKARWASRGDQRITPVGRLLRKTRIDELPQMINVLCGEMSFVGPRPERPEFVAELHQALPFYYTRLMVKPGITGWAQIHYDYGNTIEDALVKLQYDFYYLRYWSVWLDLYTIFKTFKVVFQFKGL